MTDVLNDGYSDISVVDSMGNDLSVVQAARVSYAGDRPSLEEHLTWGGEKDVRLIQYMADHAHGTPFEHTSITFHIACPLFVRGQWHRHRIGWSYNEISRRYTTDEISFHVPSEWRVQNKSGNKQGSQVGELDQYDLQHQYDIWVDAAEKVFEFFVGEGVANEQARMVLPQSMYTRFYATCNLRSAAHFMQLRDDPHAQPEIRAYAKEMRELLRSLYPVSVAALMGEHHSPVEEGTSEKTSWKQAFRKAFGSYA